MLELNSTFKETAAVALAGAVIGAVAWMLQSPDFEKALAPPEKASDAELTAMLEPTSPENTESAENKPKVTAAPKMISFMDVIGKFFGESNVTFVDGRDQNTYELGHIPSAINIDAEQLESDPKHGANVLAKIPKNQVMIVYCSGGGCTLSKILAANLIGRGYAKVLIFEGGWNEWVDQGQLKEEGPMAVGGAK